MAESRKPRVVLEGCNGDWAGKRYLPFLVRKAVEGEIDLWVTDLGEPSPQTTEFLKKIGGANRYIDKVGNLDSYEDLSDMNYVFVVVPDQYHSEVTQFWLEAPPRLAPKGRIFIEKPLDSCLRRALRLQKIVQSWPDTVYGFDHYLARAYPFLQEASQYLKEIDQIASIDFRILEPEEIPLHRVKALSGGIIFDLFCHVLAVVGAVVELKVSPSLVSLLSIQLRDVTVARYRHCLIPGETTAWIKFVIKTSGSEEVEITSSIGKGGQSKEKFMMIKGASGTAIKLDFIGHHAWLINHRGQRPLVQLQRNHVASFLQAILSGTSPQSAPGVLEYDVALEILSILDEAKE